MGKLYLELDKQSITNFKKKVMKTELKAKFLQHILNKKQNDEGFTLIELLVVIIIIGILSAIALPSFLNQANKAKQSEAKTYVGSANRSQQAYFAENGAFASQTEFSKLGLGVNTQTQNYKYEVDGGGSGSTSVTTQAKPQASAIKAYIGGVSLSTIAGTSEATSLAILCEATVAKGQTGAPDGDQTPTFVSTGSPTCPSTNYVPIK